MTYGKTLVKYYKLGYNNNMRGLAQKKKYFYVFFCLLILFFSCKNNNTERRPLKVFSNEIIISTLFKKGTYHYILFKLVYKEVFKRLKLKFKLQINPAKRSLLLANQGKVHADASRIFHLKKGGEYENLIRVNESISKVELTAFTVKYKNIRVNWSSLRKSKYTVAYQHGIKLVEINLKTPKQYIYKVHSVEEGLRMLIYGRVDIVIHSTISIEVFKKRNYFRGKGITNIGLLSRTFLYPYFNKKYKTLALKLEKVLKNMKADGTYYRLRRKAYRLVGITD